MSVSVTARTGKSKAEHGSIDESEHCTVWLHHLWDYLNIKHSAQQGREDTGCVQSVMMLQINGQVGQHANSNLTVRVAGTAQVLS